MTVAGLWRGDQPLLLASASPVRRALLEAAGLPVETEISRVDERGFEACLGPSTPTVVALRLAEAKARSVSERRGDRLVIGADQVLDLDGEALGKPLDREAAIRQLERLAGRAHTLVSAVAMARGGRIETSFTERAELAMRHLSRDEIVRYVAWVGPAATCSAGSYEVEGIGIHLFERISGEHSTILGFPMIPVLAALRRMGLVGL